MGAIEQNLSLVLALALTLALHACAGTATRSSGGPSGAPSPGTAAAGSSTDVTAYHNDLARTGQNLNETVLTLANVNASSFGKIRFLAVDGKVDGQPLHLSSLTIAGQQRNVLYVVTEHDSIFAFDADSGAELWKVSILGSGEAPSDDHGCTQITPEIGITSTPVIDRQLGPNGVIFVVGMSKDSAGKYHQRLHALDVTTGGELFGGPKEVQASYPGTGANSSGGQVIFDPGQYAERVGMTLLNGVVYTAWTSHCDIPPYTGWVIGYNASSLNQTSVLNLTPNGSEGSVWMSGTAMAADSAGNIFFLDANGTFDTTLDANGFPSRGDFGNAFIKLSTANGKLSVADYFAAFNTVQESNADEDLGSGGALVLPDVTDASGQVHHLALGAGKDMHIYVVNRDSMGKFNPSGNGIYQDIAGALGGPVFSMPAYFNKTVYYGAVGDHIKAFPITNAKLATTPSALTGNSFPYPGATPSVSANGSSNGIVWAVENGGTAVLHAYNAASLSQELYNSSQAGPRDVLGFGNKFITPTIVNGKVFVGTTNGVAVFGLLH